MACGTGKTFTALKICEQIADDRRNSQDPVPRALSIPAVPNAARMDRSVPGGPCGPLPCSVLKVSRAVEDITYGDVPLPATTDPATLVAQMAHRKRAKDPVTVVFSAYQSINVIAEAQRSGSTTSTSLL